MIRAIFLDVDGTLISFKTHEIPASARDALVRAHARGIRLFIATGRAANDLAPLEDSLRRRGVAQRRTVCGCRRACRKPALDSAGRFRTRHGTLLADGIPAGAGTGERRIRQPSDPEVERLAHMVAHPVPEQTDLRALFERSECCQMCFYLDTEAERRVMAQLPGLAASRWCPIFADINVAGIDKATGMREFMSACGLRASEVAAFGDGGNDVAMLSAAGWGLPWAMPATRR